VEAIRIRGFRHDHDNSVWTGFTMHDLINHFAVSVRVREIQTYSRIHRKPNHSCRKGSWRVKSKRLNTGKPQQM